MHCPSCHQYADVVTSTRYFLLKHYDGTPYYRVTLDIPGDTYRKRQAWVQRFIRRTGCQQVIAMGQEEVTA